MLKNPQLFRSELEKVNEWWLSGKVREAKRFSQKREQFEKIQAELEGNRMEIIIGPRRVGKSVLIMQAIEGLIEKGVPPDSILYYSLDDPSLYRFSDNLLKDLVDYFQENLAPRGRRYIFLDEVQLFPDWHRWIKADYDRYPEIKLVLSGSSALALQKEAQRFLHGRAVEIEVFPMGFREFLKFSGRKVERFDREDFLKMKSADFRKLGYGLREEFNEYLLTGGLPEWFTLRGEPDGLRRWFGRLVEDVTKRAIYEDIAVLFEIRNPRLLELILVFIAAHQARILAYETINEVAQLDRATLINYLEFLKSAYLIVEVQKFAGVKEQIKAKKKYLLVDQGIRNALLKDYRLREDNLGFVLENVIGMSLFLSARARGEKVFYHKSNGEVDFILEGKETVPCEVKYRSEITESEIRPFKSVISKLRTRRAVMVTKDLLKKETVGEAEVIFIPAWAFLLAV